MLCKRSLCLHAVSVRLSVRVSVTFVHSVKTNKHIFKIFHLRVATPFLFFRTKRYSNILTETTLMVKWCVTVVQPLFKELVLIESSYAISY